MGKIKELKYVTLIMLLFGFVMATSFTSCREEKKKENTEQQAEHPEGEEHPTEEATEDEHPEGGEHPEGEEHPKDSVSG